MLKTMFLSFCVFPDGITVCEGARKGGEWVWSAIGWRVPPSGINPLSLLPAAGQVSFHGDTAAKTPATLCTIGR